MVGGVGEEEGQQLVYFGGGVYGHYCSKTCEALPHFYPFLFYYQTYSQQFLFSLLCVSCI